jgi:hypothetical protein
MKKDNLRALWKGYYLKYGGPPDPGKERQTCLIVSKLFFKTFVREKNPFKLSEKLQRYKDYLETVIIDNITYLESIKSRAWRSYSQAENLRTIYPTHAIKKYREAAHFFDLLERKMPCPPQTPVYFRLASNCFYEATSLSLYFVDDHSKDLSDEKKARILLSALFLLRRCVKFKILCGECNKEDIKRRLSDFYNLKACINVPEEIKNKMNEEFKDLENIIKDLKN